MYGFFRVCFFIILTLCLSSCAKKHIVNSKSCDIDGPRELLPASVEKLRLGMSLPELENQLGEPYSPTEGLYMFSTGGNCPMKGAGRTASCGLIADFRIHDPDLDPIITESLQSCSWGAIGE